MSFHPEVDPASSRQLAVRQRLCALERQRAEICSDVALLARLLTRERMNDADHRSPADRKSAELRRRRLESRLAGLEADVERILAEARRIEDAPPEAHELAQEGLEHLTLAAAAAALGCTQRSVAQRIRSGELRARRGLDAAGTPTIFVGRESVLLALAARRARRRGLFVRAAAALVVVGAVGAAAATVYLA